jgi:hypothetical protein
MIFFCARHICHGDQQEMAQVRIEDPLVIEEPRYQAVLSL